MRGPNLDGGSTTVDDEAQDCLGKKESVMRRESANGGGTESCAYHENVHARCAGPICENTSIAATHHGLSPGGEGENNYSEDDDCDLEVEKPEGLGRDARLGETLS